MKRRTPEKPKAIKITWEASEKVEKIYLKERRRRSKQEIASELILKNV